MKRVPCPECRNRQGQTSKCSECHGEGLVRLGHALRIEHARANRPCEVCGKCGHNEERHTDREGRP
jgi:DnaJ-class molecular chaperone